MLVLSTWALSSWELHLPHLWDPVEGSSCSWALEVPLLAAFHTSQVSTSLGTLGQKHVNESISESKHTSLWMVFLIFPSKQRAWICMWKHRALHSAPSLPPPGWHSWGGRRPCSLTVNPVWSNFHLLQTGLLVDTKCAYASLSVWKWEALAACLTHAGPHPQMSPVKDRGHSRKYKAQDCLGRMENDTPAFTMGFLLSMSQIWYLCWHAWIRRDKVNC